MRPSKAIGFWNEAITLEGLADSIDRNSIRIEMPSSSVVSWQCTERYADDFKNLVPGSIETMQEPERQHHDPVDKLLVWVKARVEFPV